MVASLKEKLLSAVFKCLLYFGFVSVDARDVGLGMTGDAVKITELTISGAYIGRIEVPVNNPGHFIRPVFTNLPQFIRDKNKFRAGRIFEKKNTLFNAEKLRLKGAV